MQQSIDALFTAEGAKKFCQEIADGKRLRQMCLILSGYVLVGAMVYGVTMGMRHSMIQAGVAAVKVFALLALTLVVALPTLHFIGLLFGSRMRFQQTLTTLMTGMARMPPSC